MQQGQPSSSRRMSSSDEEVHPSLQKSGLRNAKWSRERGKDKLHLTYEDGKKESYFSINDFSIHHTVSTSDTLQLSRGEVDILQDLSEVLVDYSVGVSGNYECWNKLLRSISKVLKLDGGMYYYAKTTRYASGKVYSTSSNGWTQVHLEDSKFEDGSQTNKITLKSKTFYLIKGEHGDLDIQEYGWFPPSHNEDILLMDREELCKSVRYPSAVVSNDSKPGGYIIGSISVDTFEVYINVDRSYKAGNERETSTCEEFDRCGNNSYCDVGGVKTCCMLLAKKVAFCDPSRYSHYITKDTCTFRYHAQHRDLARAIKLCQILHKPGKDLDVIGVLGSMADMSRQEVLRGLCLMGELEGLIGGRYSSYTKESHEGRYKHSRPELLGDILDAVFFSVPNGGMYNMTKGIQGNLFRLPRGHAELIEGIPETGSFDKSEDRVGLVWLPLLAGRAIDGVAKVSFESDRELTGPYRDLVNHMYKTTQLKYMVDDEDSAELLVLYATQNWDSREFRLLLLAQLVDLEGEEVTVEQEQLVGIETIVRAAELVNCATKQKKGSFYQVAVTLNSISGSLKAGV